MLATPPPPCVCVRGRPAFQSCQPATWTPPLRPQVYNLTTYPHLVGFLDALGVDTLQSDMSFSLSMDDGKLEWGSDGLDTVFAQRRNLLSPSFLAMVKDVVRFGKEAPKVCGIVLHLGQGVGGWGPCKHMHACMRQLHYPGSNSPLRKVSGHVGFGVDIAPTAQKRGSGCCYAYI